MNYDVILPRLDCFRLDTLIVYFIVHRVHFVSFLFIGISFTSRYYSEIKENLVLFFKQLKVFNKIYGTITWVFAYLPLAFYYLHINHMNL